MDQFLRRLSVRWRILGGPLVLIVALISSIPVLILSQQQLLNQQQEISQTVYQADRALLNAAVLVSSSRVNLMRYVQDVVPSPYLASSDSAQALLSLQQAHSLVQDPGLRDEIREIEQSLLEYQAFIEQIRVANEAGEEQTVSRLEFQAVNLGADIGLRIRNNVVRSQLRLTSATEAAQATAQTRLWVTASVYGVAIVAVLLLSFFVQRSIIQPLSALREGAEAFGRGEPIAVPETGSDELSLLARTFNAVAAQLSQSYYEMEQRVTERTQALAHRTAYMQAAAEVSRATNAMVDMDMLIQESVDLIRERFGLYYVGLFLKDPAAEWAVLRAGTGSAGAAMLMRGHRIRVGEGMIGWAVAHGASRVALRAGADAVRLATPELPETRSEAAIPLRSRGETIGALTVQHDEAGAFDEAAIEALQIMGDQLAVALENARLLAESQEALLATRRAYGELTRAGWEQLALAKTDAGYVAHFGGEVSPSVGHWPADMRESRQQDRMVTDGAGTTVAIPLKARDQVIGVVRLSKAAQAEEWNPQELGMMTTLIDQLGVTLDGARLYQQSQRRAAQEQLVGEMTTQMRASLNVEAVLQTVARELGRLPGVVEANVHLELPESLSAEGTATTASPGAADEGGV